MPLPDTRERLITAAMELFTLQGYERTGLAQIARKAAANPGSLYYFFPTKEDLLAATLEADAYAVELDERRLILDHLAVAEASRQPPPASWEWVSALALPRRSDGRRTNVVVRSITPAGMKVRSGITLTSGRLFRPGFEEVVVGRKIRERLLDLEVGGAGLEQLRSDSEDLRPQLP